MTQVLLLDGQQRSALAVARSLGRHGITIHVADSCATSLAGASRYARSRLLCPDPQQQPLQFTGWVRETCAARGIDVVFPVTDTSTMSLLLDPMLRDTVRLICAPAAAYARVSDKASLVEIATRAGVLVPRTIVVKGLADLESYLAHTEFPLVLKPARSRVLLDGRIVNTSVFVAQSAQEALSFARAQPWIERLPCLLQEFIPGHGGGVFALFASGAPVAWFAHRRLREKPPRGGVSVLSESVAIDTTLREAARRILEAAGYEGAAMVEFRIDPQGNAYLMEVNARLWGSLQLAIDCGVDFPWLLFQVGCNQSVAPVEPYRVGGRLRWFLGDVDHLLLELRGKGLARSGGERLRSLWNAARTSVDCGARNEVFRWSDPRPGLLEVIQWLRQLA
jgi:predicted ATP-grasp superfamily ATP-dependent carboligase